MTPVFRAILDEKIPNNTEGKDIHHWILNYRIYRNLAFSASILLSILIVAAPMALFAPVTIWYGVTIIIVYYLTNITSLIYVFIKRHTLRLKLSHLAGIAVETIVCPPCAVNLLHKITLVQESNCHLLEFLRQKSPRVRYIRNAKETYKISQKIHQIRKIDTEESETLTNFQSVVRTIIS